jgi:hypothetical protein
MAPIVLIAPRSLNVALVKSLVSLNKTTINIITAVITIGVFPLLTPVTFTLLATRHLFPPLLSPTTLMLLASRTEVKTVKLLPHHLRSYTFLTCFLQIKSLPVVLIGTDTIIDLIFRLILTSLIS